jgi:hypothetical protein
MTISILLWIFLGLLNVDRIEGAARSLGKIIETKKSVKTDPSNDALRAISKLICDNFDKPFEEFKKNLRDLSQADKYVNIVLEEKIHSSFQLMETHGLLYCLANFSGKKRFKNLFNQIKNIAVEYYPKIYNFIQALPELKGLKGRLEPVAGVLLSAYLGKPLNNTHLSIIWNLESRERMLLSKWQKKLYGTDIYKDLGDPKCNNEVKLMEILRNLYFQPVRLGISRRNTIAN